MSRFVVVLLLLIIQSNCSAQTPKDSLYLTLPDAEKIFLQKNLVLLAQQYNIDIKNALVQQAKYWDNPVLTTDQNFYDGKFFRHKTVDGQQYGEVYLQLQQVITTAGKRNKLVQLAKDDALSAQQQFDDLLRNLKYVLAGDFNTLHLLEGQQAIYKNEISAAEKLVTGMDAQLQAGNISLKDDTRVKALLFSLQSDLADIQRQQADVEKEIRTLLQQQGDTVIVPVINESTAYPTVMLASLEDSALHNRPDLQLSRTNLLSQQHNLSYQKALVVPDVTVGVEYDRLNTYVHNYWGLTVGLPIPILNRNRGNIIAAETSVRQSYTGVLQVQGQIEQEVQAAYDKLLIAQKLQPLPGLNETYDTLLQNMIQSYQQRQVSLVEFIDFFDAYKEATLKKLQVRSAVFNARAELNFVTGTPVFTIQ